MGAGWFGVDGVVWGFHVVSVFSFGGVSAMRVSINAGVSGIGDGFVFVGWVVVLGDGVFVVLWLVGAVVVPV